MTFSGIINSITLAAIVGVGAYHIKDAQAQQLVMNITEEEKYCLQQNIYFEARNQSSIGKSAVAWVTLNRVEDSRYPDTICDVVWQRKQFSWTHDGKSDEPSKNVVEQRAWKKAGKIAETVLFEWVSGKESPIGDAVMFHADYVDPYWTDAYTEVAQIDNHIFYE